MKQQDLVDKVAFTLPWLGSLIPAIMTFRSVNTSLGFEPWQALVIGVVAEGLGFTTITTTLDIFEQDEVDGRRWSAQFLVSLGGAVLYLTVVLLVNSVLGDGDIIHKATLGLLVLLAVVGGLMVALRNQLRKRRAALELTVSEEKAESGRLADLQYQREQDEIAYKRKLQEEELRMKYDLKTLKLKQKVAAPSPKVSEEPVQVAEDAPKEPGTFGKWQRWPDVPDEHKLQVAQKIRDLMQVSMKSYKRATAKWIIATFGVDERVAYMWIKYAERDYLAMEVSNGQ